MATIYPAQVDNTISLPLLSDDVSDMNADTINRLRNAIIAIENELGIKPASTYGTVRARLDAMESQLNSLAIISLAGDLGGTLSIPKVVGLQGNPISATSPSTNQFLHWNGLTWGPTAVLMDFVTPPFFCDILTTSFLSLVEVGSIITSPSFTADYTQSTSTVTIIDSYTLVSQNVSGTPTAFNKTGNYTSSTVGNVITFTLDAYSVYGVNTSTTETMTFAQKLYWGIGAAGGNSEAFIEALDGYELNLATATSFTVTAGATDYIYFAYRSALPTPEFSVCGVCGGFTLVSSTISVTNAQGFMENYTLYKSDNLNLGLTTVDVT